MRKIHFLLLLSIILGCGFGDYKRSLGNGYFIVRTNSCCVYIFNKHVKPKKYKNTIISNNRVIKPLIKKLYIDNDKIVGLKVKNKCCYISIDEKKFNTKNGYFIIYKKNNHIIEGLTKEKLKEYNISLINMKKIL